MKKKLRKLPPLNERVFARRRERQSRRWRLLLPICTLSIMALTQSYVAWSSHWRNHVLKQSTVPGWANFTKALPNQQAREMYESVQVLNEDGIPASLNINGEEWSIVRVDTIAGAGIVAETFCSKRVIAYLRDGDPRHLRQTIAHEVFHAGACIHGGDKWFNNIDPTPDTHEGTKHLGEFWPVFAHDNPLFWDWLRTW